MVHLNRRVQLREKRGCSKVELERNGFGKGETFPWASLSKILPFRAWFAEDARRIAPAWRGALYSSETRSTSREIARANVTAISFFSNFLGVDNSSRKSRLLS